MNAYAHSLLGIVLIVWTHAVFSATASTSFNVTAEVPTNCLVNATNLDFGIYLGDKSLENTSTISLRCTNTTPFSIALSTGSSGSFAQRLMKNGSNSAEYNLYINNNHTIVWGDGTGNTQILSGIGSGLRADSTLSYTVYGQFPNNPNNQAAIPGTYSDTVIVNVSY